MIYQILGLLLVCSLCADSWHGGDYAANSSIQLSHAEKLLKALVLKGDESILDLGCGDGKITAQLAKMVPLGHVIGIDPSDSMLNQAFQIKGFSNLHFQKGRAEDFSFDALFDHIISIHVMHWIPDQKTALANIRNALKPDGHLHLIFAPSKEGLPFHRALQKTLSHWKDHFKAFVSPQQVFDIETYRQLMVQAGFHIEGLHYLYHESIHDSPEKLKNWIKQWQPHMKFLQASDQPRFLDELMGNYLIEIGQDPTFTGPICWGEYVVIVEAKR